MPTRRTPLRRGERARRMTPLAEAAWRSCNYVDPHKALGLSPPETSPLPHEVTALGCYQGEPTAWMSSEQHRDWRRRPSYSVSYSTLMAYRIPKRWNASIARTSMRPRR